MEYTTTWQDPKQYITGSTSFGTYQSQDKYKEDAIKVARFTARKLGYPIVNIEITPQQVFNCFQEAINQYQTTLQESVITTNLIDVTGTSTNINYTDKVISNNINNLLFISRDYGNYLSIGKDVILHSTSIDLKAGVQVYNISDHIQGVGQVVSVLHFRPNYAGRLTNPLFLDSGLSIATTLANTGLEAPMMMLPIHDILLRMQAIQFNQQILRSGYKFDLIGDQLRIYPVPKIDYKLWIIYRLQEQMDKVYNNKNNDQSVVTNAGNIKLDKMKYAQINEPGKNWIFKYTVALSKQILGVVRSKYSEIPLAQGSINTDGDTLRSEAKEQQASLLQWLRTYVEESSTYAVMQKKAKLAQDTNQIRKRIPYRAAITLG